MKGNTQTQTRPDADVVVDRIDLIIQHIVPAILILTRFDLGKSVNMKRKGLL